MATVYLVHDLKHDRDVAIKVLHSELAASLGRDRFSSRNPTRCIAQSSASSKSAIFDSISSRPPVCSPTAIIEMTIDGTPRTSEAARRWFYYRRRAAVPTRPCVS
jgi:hypothetical protein